MIANNSKDEITVVLEMVEQSENDKKTKEILLWYKSDYLCKNFIFNGLPLYDFYKICKFASEV